MRTFASSVLFFMLVFSTLVASSAESSKTTALRNLGVTVFTIQRGDVQRGDVTTAQATSLANRVVQELSLKSFLQAVSQPGSGTNKVAREKLITDLSLQKLDGAVVGTLGENGVSFWIISSTGVRLAAGKVEKRLRMLDDSALSEVATALVDEIVRSVPYRGFLGEETGDGIFTLNLGSDHGIAKGQKLRVFDFDRPSLEAARIDRGEVEVIQVSSSTSTVEVTSNNWRVRPFQKVGFDERARGMVVETQTPTRGFAIVGGEMLSVSGTSDPAFTDRAYDFSSTPGLVLGLGWNKTAVRSVFAQARSADVDLVFAEVIGLYRFYERTSGYNRYSLSGGARVAHFAVSTKRNVTTPLESSTSFAPAADARLVRAIGGPVHVFAAANLYYPIYNTGNGAGSPIAFSYGAGGEIGALVDFTPRMSLELGGRFHLIRRPIEGQSAVQERYTQLFADVIARF